KTTRRSSVPAVTGTYYKHGFNTEHLLNGYVLQTPNAPPPPHQQQQQTSQDPRQIQSPRISNDLPQSPSLTDAENGASSSEIGQLYQMAPPRQLTFNGLPELRAHIQHHAQITASPSLPTSRIAKRSSLFATEEETIKTHLPTRKSSGNES